MAVFFYGQWLKGGEERKKEARFDGTARIQTVDRAANPLVGVVLTAILEVLDITIVSVAIPHMLGSFGATSTRSLGYSPLISFRPPW